MGVGSEVGSVNVLPMEIGRSDITRRKQRENTERERARTARRKRRRFSSSRDADGESREGAGVALGGGLKGNVDASSRPAGAGGEEVAANPSNPLGSSQTDQREDESKRTYAKFRALASQIRVAQVRRLASFASAGIPCVGCNPVGCNPVGASTPHGAGRILCSIGLCRSVVPASTEPF